MSGPSSISLPSLQPGEETSVTVQLVSPSAPGLYQSHWRACTVNGSVFGGVCVCVYVCLCLYMCAQHVEVMRYFREWPGE